MQRHPATTHTRRKQVSSVFSPEKSGGGLIGDYLKFRASGLVSIQKIDSRQFARQHSQSMNPLTLSTCRPKSLQARSYLAACFFALGFFNSVGFATPP